MQDIALVAFLRREEFEDARHLGLWASRGARWLAIDRIRSLQRRHKLLQQAPRKRGSSGHVILQIEELISRLPDRQRQVIEKSLAGFTDREIAKSLAVAPSTVRSLRRHARYQLATEFGEDER